MATLWEIDQAILACVDGETGEIVDFDKLDQLTMERDQKLENIALYIKSLEADAAAIKAEEKALADRRKVKENKAERLREYLGGALGGQPFETARVALSFRTSTPLCVTDERALLAWLEQNHDECLSYKAPTVIKDGVKHLIKMGEAVPGAMLETKQNLQLK